MIRSLHRVYGPKEDQSPTIQSAENRLQANCFIPRLRRWMKLFAGGGDTGETYFKSFWFANDFGGQRNACLTRDWIGNRR